jgi:hypothetical protein
MSPKTETGSRQNRPTYHYLLRVKQIVDIPMAVVKARTQRNREVGSMLVQKAGN